MVKVVLVLEKMPMEGYSDIAVAVCVCSCIIRLGCNSFSSLSIYFLLASRFRNFVLHPCFVLGFHHRYGAPDRKVYLLKVIISRYMHF